MTPPLLPRPLRRFSELLSLFHDDVTVPLGDLSRRLMALVGPLRAPSTLGDGDPEGYAGLSRRGAYERLLLTEWLLAEELPDEFLRRAVSGEHAFLQLQRAAEQGHRRSVVLFDAGPSMLGGPRLVQLAVLVLMATRAAASGVDFAFGLLQDQGESRGEGAAALYTAVDGRSIAAFLQGRTVHEPTSAHVERWLDQLGPLERADDVWIVSGPRLCGEVGGLSHLVLEEELSLDGAKVSAAVADRLGRVGRSLSLELPADPIRRQLLLRPLKVSRAPRPVLRELDLDPAAGVVFSPSGRRVLARRLDGRVVVAHVPQRADRSAKFLEYWPRQSDQGLTPVAVGWRRKRAIVVRMGEGRLTIEGEFGPDGRRVRFHDLPLPPVLAGLPLGDRLGAAFYNQGDASSILLFSVYRTDGFGALFGALVDEPDTCLVRPMSREPMVALLGTEPLTGGLFLDEEQQLLFREWGVRDGQDLSTQHRLRHQGELRGAVLGRASERWRDWTLFVEGGQLQPPPERPFPISGRSVEVRPGGRLVGALAAGRSEASAPVVLYEDRQFLEVLSGEHAGVLVLDPPWAPTGPIALSPVEPLAAWATPQHLVVVDLSGATRGLRHLVACEG